MKDKELLKELAELGKQYLYGLVTAEEMCNKANDMLAIAGYLTGVERVE